MSDAWGGRIELSKAIEARLAATHDMVGALIGEALDVLRDGAVDRVVAAQHAEVEWSAAPPSGPYIPRRVTVGQLHEEFSERTGQECGCFTVARRAVAAVFGEPPSPRRYECGCDGTPHYEGEPGPYRICAGGTLFPAQDDGCGCGACSCGESA